MDHPFNTLRFINHFPYASLHWRHNDHDGVSNHQPHGCLLNRLFRCRSKKTSKLRVTGLCVGNSQCSHLMTSSCFCLFFNNNSSQRLRFKYLNMFMACLWLFYLFFMWRINNLTTLKSLKEISNDREFGFHMSEDETNSSQYFHHGHYKCFLWSNCC